MTEEIATMYPGGESPPIKTFPEKLEKDIGNIVGGFKIENGKDSLVLELLEYITEKYGKN